MLKPRGKTKVPNWTTGYHPHWQDSQWVVIFTDRDAAQEARVIMQREEFAPLLDIAPYPGSNTSWYVGEVD